MDFTNQDLACYLPLNRSGTIFDINHRYQKSDYQTLALFLVILTCSFLHKKECFSTVLGTLLKLLLYATLSLIILPIVFVILFIFAIYRLLIIIIQQIKLRETYGGILFGSDAIWTIEDSYARSVINVLIVVNSEEDGITFYKRIERQIQKTFFETPNGCVKLLATHEQYGGYFFLRKNSVDASDCIKRLDSSKERYIEKDDLMILLSKISNSTLPKNHSAFWEVHVGTQNVRWHSNTQECYPILFRIHHALGDGTSLLKVLIQTLAGQVPVPSELNGIDSRRRSCMRTFQVYAKKLLILIQAPYAILLQGMVRENDDSILHGPVLSGEKNLVFSTETQRPSLGIIKNIKEKVPGIKCSDVLFTAISGSLQEYLAKNSTTVPETITSVIPIFGCDTKESDIENTFTIALLDIPIMKRSKNFNVTDALSTLSNETTILNSAVDYQVNYWILNVVSKYLPEPLLRPLIESSQATIVISNLPGPKRISLFEEYPVEDIVFWIPHRASTGLGVSILSYDGRLQIGLNADRALIDKREDAQSIVDGILEEISRMGDEINERV